MRVISLCCLALCLFLACVRADDAPKPQGNGKVEPQHFQGQIINAERGVNSNGNTTRPAMNLQVGHSGSVTSIDAFPDGKRLLTTSWDGTLKIWDISTAKVLRTIWGSAQIFRARVSPNGVLIASVSKNTPSTGDIRIYRSDSGVLVKTLSGHTQGLFDVVFTKDSSHLISAGKDSTIRVWDLEMNVAERVMEGHDGEINTLALSRDGKVLVSAGSDKTVRVWDWANGLLLRTLFTFESPVYGVDVSPDGALIAATDTESIQLIETQSGNVRKTWNAFPKGIKRTRAWVHFSPNGNLVLSGTDAFGRENYIWEVATGTRLVALRQDFEWGLSDRAFSNDAVFSIDGKTVFTSSRNCVESWKSSDGDFISRFGIPGLFAAQISQSRDGIHCAVPYYGHTFLWNLQSGVLEASLPVDSIHNTVTFDSGSATAVVASSGQPGVAAVPGKGMLLYDLKSHQTTWAFQREGKAYSLSAISKDGSVLALSSGDTIDLWDFTRRKFLKELTRPEYGVRSLAFSPTGDLLASGDTKGNVRIWNASTGQLTQTITGTPTGSLQFSPNGHFVFCDAMEFPSVVTELRNVSTGAMEGSYHRGGQLTIAPDGTTCAFHLAGAGARQICIAQIPKGEPQSRINIAKGTAMGLSYSPDGKRILAYGQDSVLRVYELPTWRLMASLYIIPSGEWKSGTTEWITTTPDGYYNCSSEVARTIQFTVGAEAYPAECFAAKYYRPDLVERALRGEKVPPPENFKGMFPPRLWVASGDNKSENGAATVTLHVEDDSAVENVAFFVNGAKVEASSAELKSDTQPITADGRPIPADGRAISADGRTLTAEGRAIEADGRALIADGRPLTADEGTMPVTVARTMTFRVPVPADGDGRVQVLAFDDDGLQSPRQELLFTPAVKAPLTGNSGAGGRLIGLCVGVSRYQHEKLNLKFADKDALELTAALNAQRGLYREAQVTALTDDKATRAGITTALDRLVAHTTRDDTVFLLLAGHGWRGPETLAGRRNFFFATHEIAPENIAATALPWSDVVSQLGKLSSRSRRVIVLLDACHSGSAAGNEELVKEILNANAGVLVFAGSRGSEESLESADWQHGAFTKAVLEAVAGQAASEDKAVSVWDFASYVKKRVVALTENQQHPQVPFLSDFDTDAALMTIGGAPLPHVVATPRAAPEPKTPGALVPQPDLQLSLGEIRLAGIVRGVDRAKRIVTLDATGFTLPDGKTSKLARPKAKIVFVTQDALIHPRGDTTKTLALSDIKAGQEISVVGTDLGSGQMLPAREIAVAAR